MTTDIAKMSARRKNVPSGIELAARIREGWTAAGLASEYDVSKSMIARAVNDAGFSTSDGRSAVQSYAEKARVPVVSFGWLGYTEDLDAAACYQHPTLPEDAWFPSTSGERRVFEAAAKAVCADCPVATLCLSRALAEEETGERFGIRGGLNEDERAALVESGAA